MFSTFSWLPRLLLRSLCCWRSPPVQELSVFLLWHQGFLLMFELQRFVHDVPHHDCLWFYPIWGSLGVLNLSITSFTKFGKALTIISSNTVCLALTFLLLQDSSCPLSPFLLRLLWHSPLRSHQFFPLIFKFDISYWSIFNLTDFFSVISNLQWCSSGEFIIAGTLFISSTFSIWSFSYSLFPYCHFLYFHLLWVYYP